MKKLIFRLIVAYLRRNSGSIDGWMQPYHAKLRHERRYYIALMSEHHYYGLKSNTTWSRGQSL